MAVVLGHDQDVESWRLRHRAGEVADGTPYGYDAADEVFEMRWSVAHAERPVVRRIRARLVSALGFDLVHAWRNRRLIRWADVVWTHTEREHLAVAAVQALRPRRRTPVLAQSVWLWDRWPTWGATRRALVARLLRTHPVECTHSRVNREISAATVPGRRVIVLPFGTTVPALDPSSAGAPGDRSGRPLVLALGNDVDRDWDLFLAVTEQLPELDFRIACHRRSIREMPWPAHVSCGPAASRAEVDELFGDAAVVAVPLRPNRHASGATTCIEATGAGRPVVATATGGIEDYLPPETDLVTVGDVDGWVRALREVVGSPATVDARFVLRHGLTQRDYVARYVALTWDLLGVAPADDGVSQFRSAGDQWPQAAVE
ncbi:glycosyltransferase family 4 protein [Aeromicrobium sp. zg-636]|uniref:Glycosyltransferase family 4 protein n=1 Tax=Aeromicrobium senzhongii TaxID=2663859 RepID=A0A8I0EWI6_9ACTN|nr:glycosyltransferase [Aeromicrobium sp. 636]MBC9227701.1 glycosyltransferase family 4 protein [Aeromicrobium senzhongii]